IGAVVALVHLAGLGTDGKAQHLVTQADAEQRFAGGDQLLDLGDRVGTGRSGIAGAIGEKPSIGLALEDLVGAGGGRYDHDLASRGGKAAQDVALEAVVHSHHAESGLVLPAIALAPGPPRLVPGVALCGGDLGDEGEAQEPWPRLGLRLELVDIEVSGGLMRNGTVGHAMLADAPSEGARIDACKRNDAPPLEPDI